VSIPSLLCHAGGSSSQYPASASVDATQSDLQKVLAGQLFSIPQDAAHRSLKHQLTCIGPNEAVTNDYRLTFNSICKNQYVLFALTSERWNV